MKREVRNRELDLVQGCAIIVSGTGHAFLMHGVCKSMSTGIVEVIQTHYASMYIHHLESDQSADVLVHVLGECR